MIVESFSGIRGLYGKDINTEIARKYVIAYAQFLKLTKQEPTIVVGMDTRPSSDPIRREMIDELLSNGCDVLDVEVNTTPAIELAVREYKADGGIIITGSHNEPEYNGWKFLTNNGSILEPEDADLVISNYRNQKPEIKLNNNIHRKKFILGKLGDREIETRKNYVNFILDSVGKEGIEKIKARKLKIIVDPNGGAAATVIKEVMQKLGADIIEKNMKLGEFKRPIEPNSKTLAYLSSAVKKEKADLAAGFDCDGDRVEMIDDNGEMLSGQYVLALIVEEILSQNKQENSVVVVNDATSGVVKEIVERHDAKFEEVEVGEINVVKALEEKKSPVGGEGSNGGVIIPPSKCRDAIQGLAIIMRLIARTGKKISQINAEFPKYYTPRTNVRCEPDLDMGNLKKKIEELFIEEGYKIKKTGDETGGLKILIDDTSWIWYRQSKTEAGVFRVIVDSKSEEKSDELLKKGEKVFNEAVRTI